MDLEYGDDDDSMTTPKEIQDINQFTRDLLERARLYRKAEDNKNKLFSETIQTITDLFINLENALLFGSLDKSDIPLTIFINLTRVVSDFEVPESSMLELFRIMNWIDNFILSRDKRKKVIDLLRKCFHIYLSQWIFCLTYVEKAYNQERRILEFEGTQSITESVSKISQLADSYNYSKIDEYEKTNKKKQNKEVVEI